MSDDIFVFNDGSDGCLPSQEEFEKTNDVRKDTEINGMCCNAEGHVEQTFVKIMDGIVGEDGKSEPNAPKLPQPFDSTDSNYTERNDAFQIAVEKRRKEEEDLKDQQREIARDELSEFYRKREKNLEEKKKDARKAYEEKQREVALQSAAGSEEKPWARVLLFTESAKGKNGKTQTSGPSQSPANSSKQQSDTQHMCELLSELSAGEK